MAKFLRSFKRSLARRILPYIPNKTGAKPVIWLRKKLEKWIRKGSGGKPRVSVRKDFALSRDFEIETANWNRFVDMTISALDLSLANDLPKIRVLTKGKTKHGDIIGVEARSYYGEAAIGSFLDGLGDRDWVAFLGDDDKLSEMTPKILASQDLIDTLIAIADLAMVEEGSVRPLFAPGADYIHALNCDYFKSRFFARASAVRDAVAKGAKTPREIALAILEICHWSSRPNLAVSLGVPLIEFPADFEAFYKERVEASNQLSCILPSKSGPCNSLDIDLRSIGPVSVVICTHNKGYYVRQLVRSILSYPSDLVSDIVVVSNRTSNANSLFTLKKIGEDSRVNVIYYEQPFNFSIQNNIGAALGSGNLILFLNDDIIPISKRWLEELIAPFISEKTGAVGPLLLYPDETVQHAGMYLGFQGIAGHTLRYATVPDGDFGFLLCAPRRVSSVTGAVLLVRRADFEKLNGFDRSLRHWIQDVDLCMRLKASGRHIVFNPRSALFHMESLTVKSTIADDNVLQARHRELLHFEERWGDKKHLDPFRPPLLDVGDESLKTLSTSPSFVWNGGKEKRKN